MSQASRVGRRRHVLAAQGEFFSRFDCLVEGPFYLVHTDAHNAHTFIHTILQRRATRDTYSCCGRQLLRDKGSGPGIGPDCVGDGDWCWRLGLLQVASSLAATLSRVGLLLTLSLVVWGYRLGGTWLYGAHWLPHMLCVQTSVHTLPATELRLWYTYPQPIYESTEVYYLLPTIVPRALCAMHQCRYTKPLIVSHAVASAHSMAQPLHEWETWETVQYT